MRRHTDSKDLCSIAARGLLVEQAAKCNQAQNAVSTVMDRPKQDNEIQFLGRRELVLVLVIV